MRFRLSSMAFATALGLAASAGAQAAAELKPVDAVLARIAASEPKPAARADTAPAVLKAIVAFRTHSSELTPPEAAVQWLNLWDRTVALDDNDNEYDESAIDPLTRHDVGPASLLAALPSPEAWPMIRQHSVQRAAKRPDDAKALVLRLIAEILVRDSQAALQTLEVIEGREGKGDAGDSAGWSRVIEEAREEFLKVFGTREQIVAAFRASLAHGNKSGGGLGLEIPDLVGLVGEARAEEILVEALKSPVDLTLGSGEATKAMARRLALREIDHLQRPQWALVDSVGTAALYEAMQARFDSSGRRETSVPANDAEQLEQLMRATPQEFWRKHADPYYFIDLVIAGRRADADRMLLRLESQADAMSMHWDVMDELVRRGHNEVVQAYLTSVLRRRPQSPLWSLYLEQSALLGRSKEALGLLDAVLKQPESTGRMRAWLMGKRVDALLAADRPDDALVAARALLATPPRIDDPARRERIEAALRVAGVGRVLKRPEWSRLGLDYARRAIDLPTKDHHQREYERLALLVELRRQGQADAAQSLVLASMEREISEGGGPRREALIELVGLYDAAGRHADVRRMFEALANWGARDVAEFAIDKDSMGTPVGLMAARALKAVGDRQGAARAARAVALDLPGHDPAYELWIEMAGESAVAELDKLAAADPFEERPLIWKAVALSAAGQLPAAEDAVRRAIAIDPSDGEQGVNDRMRAYAVLADILEARSDAKGAQDYRRAVAAIRLSERADELHRLGLFPRAFAGYRAALAEFSDAYCIQSRLAVQLGRVGRQDEALQHYRRAFELMPESFGRMESHCFGCESVFGGRSAQAVAEEVFTGLMARNTTRPQVPYMLGYLRMAQGRHDEAAALFRQAIAMDASYLGAWRQLNELNGRMYVDPAERDIVTLRLLELDPARRHVRYALDTVADLPALWRTVDRPRTADDETAFPSSSLYPLGTGAPREGEHDSGASSDREEVVRQAIVRSRSHGQTGRLAFNLVQHRLFNAALQLMEQLDRDPPADLALH